MDNYNGFYKVSVDGFSLTNAIFFNPTTQESFSKIIWDIDNDRLLEDDTIQFLRNMPINENVRKQWLRHIGVISVGDTIKVIKGRKVKIGTISKVVNIYPWRDKYGRTQTTYVVLETGEKTNINNCMLV